MFRNGIFAGIVLLTAACAAGINSQPDLALEEQAIRDRGEAMMAAENVRDFATSVGFYAADAVVQGPGRPAFEGREAIRAMLEQSSPPAGTKVVGAMTRRVIAVASSGDLAWEHGQARTTFTTPAAELVNLSKQMIVWKKVAGVWYVAGISWSGDAPPRPAITGK